MNTLYAILGFIIDNWTAISSIILFIFTVAYGYKNPKTSAIDYAKGIAQKLMFALEKRSTEYLQTDEGKAKFKLVVESGYSLFPASVRLFVSKPAFEIIVQGLHDEAIKFLEDQIKKETPVSEQIPATPVVEPPVVVADPVTPTQDPTQTQAQ